MTQNKKIEKEKSLTFSFYCPPLYISKQSLLISNAHHIVHKCTKNISVCV